MKIRFTNLAIIKSTQQLTFQLEYLKRILQCLCLAFAFNSSLAQNVGIGTDSPKHKLEVIGNIKGDFILATGSIGIGTMSPGYKLHVFNGPVAISNTTDNMTWSMSYNSITNGVNVFNNSGLFMTLLNTGNLGIGTSTPASKLDVNGNIHARTNAAVDGNLTVNNGKGVMQNSQGSGQLKYYTRTATFTASNLAGFGLSGEGTISFTGGSFSSPPKVFVGDVVGTDATLGEIFRVQLMIYDVIATGCKVRLLNTSPNTMNYTTTWNIICVGE